MQKHTKIFSNFWDDNLTIAQTYRCFGCDSWKGTDIHHIEPKQMGGSKCKDHITNLTCLCRKCHELCHKSKDYNKSVQAKTLRLIADKLEEQIEGTYEH